MGVKDRRADLETNMANTLQRLKAAVESDEWAALFQAPDVVELALFDAPLASN